MAILPADDVEVAVAELTDRVLDEASSTDAVSCPLDDVLNMFFTRGDEDRGDAGDFDVVERLESFLLDVDNFSKSLAPRMRER